MSPCICRCLSICCMGLTEYQNICGIEEYLLIFIINVLIIVPTGLGILTYIIIFVDLLSIFIVAIITNTKNFIFMTFVVIDLIYHFIVLNYLTYVLPTSSQLIRCLITCPLVLRNLQYNLVFYHKYSIKFTINCLFLFILPDT